MNNKGEVKVSVLMTTYNHDKYITDSINSILMQKVDFDYEIVIGEDCSTDNTREILLQFKDQYPEKIKLFLHEKNVGMHVNFECIFNACRGDYIAVLEGDDYWTSDNKLQKQVDLFESNFEVVECFHKVKTVYENDDKKSHIFPDFLKRNVFYLNDVISDFFIPTLSIMFKKSAINTLPKCFYDVKNPDWLIHILCAEKGNIVYIDEVMGVYRVHAGGVWSGITKVKVLENTIKSAHVVNRYLHFKYETLFKRRISGWHHEAGIILFRELKILKAARHYMSCIKFRIILLTRLKLNRL